MGKIVLTCVLALVFGFGGAAGAVSVLQDSFLGPQGPTGLTGATGPTGHDGIDGIDGKDGRNGRDGKAGPRGPRGRAGAAGKDAAPLTQVSDLGTLGCAGRSVSVITDARIVAHQQLRLTRKDVCIVGPAHPGVQQLSAR